MKKRRKLDDFYAFAKSVHIAYGSNPVERGAASPRVVVADAQGEGGGAQVKSAARWK